MPSSTGRGAIHIVDGVTSVDCQRQVRSWSLFRSIVQLLIPTCNGNFSKEQLERRQGEHYYNNSYHHYVLRRLRRNLIPSNIISTNTNTTKITNITTGTIFGYRRGKVNFCIQSNPSSSTPILLLELAIPTAILAKEMKSGLIRIALECNYSNPSRSSSLLSVPVWTMYCNGRKAGFAIKRVPTQADKKVLRLMQSVVEGVGLISGKKLMNTDDGHHINHDHDDLIYLRANFERVSGSSNSESFHLINPDGSNSQQLSIFFLRSS